jgi:hypothetical protein
MDLEKLQEQFRNTIKSAVSGKMSPKNIKETIKNNLNNLTNSKDPIELNISQNSPNITPSITQNIETSNVGNSSSTSYWFIFKIILAIIIIGLLVLNLYSYFIYGVDGFTFLFSDIPNQENTEENSLEKLKKSDQNASNIEDNSINTKKNKIANNIEIEAVKMARNQKKMSSDIENTIENKNKKNKHYKANNVATNVNKKAGYCYVGSDRNVRTCVEVSDENTCMSGEVFPTRDLCINPKLKD